MFTWGVYKPQTARLAIVQSRISARSWAARVATARRAERFVLRVRARVARGDSLNEALRKTTSPQKRSWLLRCWMRMRQGGLEALIDARTPREPRLSQECGGLIRAARMANPKVKPDEVLDILREQQVERLPSVPTIKRHFRRTDEHRRYSGSEQTTTEVVELVLAGGELLLAAEAETGLLAALTEEVMALAAQAKDASLGKRPAKDTRHRDRRGHFTARYNRLRRRRTGQAIASYLRPAAEKAVGRVPSWPRFVRERRQTIEAKVRMLVMSWMVSQTKGWAALRAPQAAALEPLTGYAYMPSTLAKMTSALAISGAATRMLVAVGRRWHAVAQERWGEPGAMAAVYIDNHAKEVWSSLFTMSGKVTHLSRVMPCITTTYVHTGAGTPLVASVQSGAAPLAPRLLELVKQAELQLGGDVRRAVVIDSEGSTFDILEAFVNSAKDAAKSRVIVTPLRPSRAPELELRHTAGSYFRPYREHDQLRIAAATLRHRGTGRSIEIGVLEVRRDHRESDTVLLTNGLALGMEGRDLADLYFARWPVQENFFKNGKVLGLAEHRGNCGTMVANVAVESELEKLARRAGAAEAKMHELDASHESDERETCTARREHARAQRSLATRRQRLDALVARGKCEGKQFCQTAIELNAALGRVEKASTQLAKVTADSEQRAALRKKLVDTIANIATQRAKLMPRRRIRQIDVALDSTLTATKLAASLLLGFALREYLPAVPMSPQTFLSRVLPVTGRRETRPDEEHVVFQANPRDPEVTEALQDACRRLNKRALKRDGRRLRYEVEEPQAVES